MLDKTQKILLPACAAVAIFAATLVPWQGQVDAQNVPVYGLNATSIQGVQVSSTRPTNGQALIYSSTSGQYAPGSGGSGAMTLISKQVASGAPATITFSAIPQNFTNLRLICNFAGLSGNIQIQFNGDTSTHYQYGFLYVAGGAPLSAGGLTEPSILFGYNSGIATLDITSYANPLTGVAASGTLASVSGNLVGTAGGAWSTDYAAVTSIVLSDSNAGNFTNGSTFSLYGIQ